MWFPPGLEPGTPLIASQMLKLAELWDQKLIKN